MFFEKKTLYLQKKKNTLPRVPVSINSNKNWVLQVRI